MFNLSYDRVCPNERRSMSGPPSRGIGNTARTGAQFGRRSNESNDHLLYAFHTLPLGRLRAAIALRVSTMQSVQSASC